MNKIFGLIVIIFTIIACKNEEKDKVDVSNSAIKLTIERFEQQFYSADENSLQHLKVRYPYLFPVGNSDSIWLQKINNKEEQFLYKKSQELFSSFTSEKQQIENLFKHIAYYHPKFEAPKVITLITNLDYQNKVVYADSLLFVSLDMYLGETFEAYHEFPFYLSKNYQKSQLVVDIANEISKRYITANRNRQFLDALIYEGKKLYMLDCYLPEATDAQKMGYTTDEITWVMQNEAQIWTYFVENNLLYSTDSNLNKRFIDNAPFSKFFIDIDKESPGRVGSWLGWQIVRSYMNNNHVTLQQLLQVSADEIFKQSKYKPKK
jgi:gliding motility-associated lipoprotein GldB